ncbi:MAG: hypothetical protein WBA74_07625 [Cyclobacteriaceae bacterium]
MKDDDLTGKDSLLIIESMITTAKGNVASNQYYFVMWGWVIALINLFVYVSETFFEFAYAQMAWMICFPLGIFTAIHAARKAKERKVKTHLDDLFKYMWMGFFIAIIIIVAAGSKIGYYINPMIILITSFPTLVTGLAIRFKPLIYGGTAFWLFAAAGFASPHEYHSLIGAIAIIIGYLVPGYLLKRKAENESL